MRRPLQTLLAVACLLAFSPLQATVHVVTANNFFYSPDNISINAGDTVRFQWVAGTHPTSSTSGDWTGFVSFPLNSGQPTFDLAFPNPGTYNYQCDFHVSIGMVGTVVVTGAPACSSSLIPTNQSSTNEATRVRLDWDPQPAAVGCQVQGKRLPTGPTPSVNILAGDISTTNVPNAVAGAGTQWTWRVRCACSISPLDVSAFTAYGDTFNIPLAREIADLGDDEMVVYPTLASSQASLRYRAMAPGMHAIEWMDASGRVLATRQAELASGEELWDQFDVSALPNGAYMVTVHTESGPETKRFTVLH